MTLSALTRDESHVYRVGGQSLVSVTQAIKIAGLMGDTSLYTDQARDRGTAVHSMVEYFDQGDLELDTLDPALMGYLDAYRLFLADYEPEWQLIEAQRADTTLRYAGTVDRAGMLKGIKHPVVLDVKSGSPEAWHPIQLSAYKHLVAMELAAALIVRFALYLSADGRYRLEPFPLADGPDWQIFCAALALAQWKERHLS